MTLEKFIRSVEEDVNYKRRVYHWNFEQVLVALWYRVKACESNRIIASYTLAIAKIGLDPN